MESELIPEWVTLHEACFLTGESEEGLRGIIDRGLLTCDRSLVEQLGPSFVRVRVRDLEGAGLLGFGSSAGEAVNERPPDRVEPPPDVGQHAAQPQLSKLIPLIEHDRDRPFFVNDEASTWGAERAVPPAIAAPRKPPAPAASPGPASPTPAPAVATASPESGSFPPWMTIREAAFLTGVSEESLRRRTDAGLVASDPALSNRLGPRFLLLRSADLVRAGLLESPVTMGETIPALEPVPPASSPPTGIVRAPESPRAALAPSNVTTLVRPVPDQGGRSAITPGATNSDIWTPPSSAVEAPTRAIPADLPPQVGRTPPQVGGALRLTRTILLWTVLGLGAALLLSVTLPLAFGYRTFVVSSSTMEPGLHRGDVVVGKVVSPLDVRVGDVVTFRDPKDPTVVVTHRVRAIDPGPSTIRFTTKGDADAGTESWSIPRDGHLSRVSYHIWKVGYLLNWFRSPVGLILLVLVPVILVGGLVVLKKRSHR